MNKEHNCDADMRAALKMAIAQIEWADHLHDWHDGLLDALTACKEVIEQPSTKNIMDSFDEMLKDKIIYYRNKKFLPIGYYYPDERSAYLLFQKGLEIPKDALPLYESFAPSWQGLSDDEAYNIWNKNWKDGDTHLEFARAIEQELRTKNGFSDIKEKNS